MRSTLKASDLLLDRWIDRLPSLFRRLSYPEAQRVGRLFGQVAFRIPGRERQRTLTHLSLGFPEMGARAREELAQRVFQHFGKLLGETLWLASQPVNRLWEVVTLEGFDLFESCIQNTGPTFIVTGHCGHWELIHASVSLKGYPVHVVARDLQIASLGKQLLEFRGRYGTCTILRGTLTSGKALLTALRRCAILGFAIDQDTQVEGVWVPFFGFPAFTPVGPAELALRFRASVVPVFAERMENGRHRIRFEPPVELPSDPVALTAELSSRIEAQVRRFPEQWVWNHRRWRRQPEGASLSRERGSTSLAPRTPKM